MTWVELVGYAGSVLVAGSLTMNNIWRLRWINLFGASTLAVYGLLIHAMPVFALNSFITMVDVYYLVRLAQRRDAFSFFEVPPDSPFLREFLRFYHDDIACFFPSFDLRRYGRPHIRLILRNMLPVGVFVCNDSGHGIAEVCLDYVVPGYRDLRNARFAFSASHERLMAAGLHTFLASSEVATHKRYLRQIGFVEDPVRPNRFTRPV